MRDQNHLSQEVPSPRAEAEHRVREAWGGELLRVGEVLVDAQALCSLKHDCDPLLCRRTGSCCQGYDVWLDRAERDRLLEMLPAASAVAPALLTTGGIRQVGPGTWVLGRTATDLCAFAYRGSQGEVLCSLHAMAARKGWPPEQCKPRGCVLWPLSLSSSRPPVLSVHGDAYSFPCNQRVEATRELTDGVAEAIQGSLGAVFLDRLRQALS